MNFRLYPIHYQVLQILINDKQKINNLILVHHTIINLHKFQFKLTFLVKCVIQIYICGQIKGVLYDTK